jgi:hypothetical protein
MRAQPEPDDDDHAQDRGDGMPWQRRESTRRPGARNAEPRPAVHGGMARGFCALLAALLLGLNVAPSPAAESERLRLDPLPNARVGRVDGTRAFIGVSLDGRRLRAYVCDGTVKRKPKIKQWFRGRWDGRSPLTLKAGGLELHIDAVAADGAVTGRLALRDGEHAFSARARPAPAGLHHRLRDGRGATWILLSERSMRGTFISSRPRKCRAVLVTNSNGTQSLVTVCS